MALRGVPAPRVQGVLEERKCGPLRMKAIMNGNRSTLRWLLMLGVTVTVGLVVTYRHSAAQRGRARSVSCANSICAIVLAARLYANEHDGLFPINFTCFSNELVTPKVLRCSADLSRARAIDWHTFTEANSSYEIVAPGLRE